MGFGNGWCYIGDKRVSREQKNFKNWLRIYKNIENQAFVELAMLDFFV